MEELQLSNTAKDYIFIIQLTGFWPKRNASLLYKTYSYITMILITIFGGGILVKAIIDFTDIAEFLYSLNVVSVVMQCILKFLLLHSRRSDFFQIFTNLDDPTFTASRKIKKYNDYIESKIRLTNRSKYLLLFFALGAVFIVNIGPFFTIKTNWVLPFPFPIDMNKQSTTVFAGMWIFQIIMSVTISFNLSGLDCLNYTLLWIAVGELQILQKKIIASAKLSYRKFKNVEEGLNVILKDCVTHHIAIEKFVVSVENAFNLIFLVQILASLIPICVTGLNLILVPVVSIQFGSSACFFVAIILEFALSCVPGNELSLQSQKINDACYTMEWYNCSYATCKTLFLVMERSKKPLYATAGKFINLSLDTLFTVLKSAFSYFMVLHKLYGDK